MWKNHKVKDTSLTAINVLENKNQKMNSTGLKMWNIFPLLKPKTKRDRPC